MDPLSILVSAITLTGATIEVSKAILRLVGAVQRAPDDLASLSNDISDFTVILSNIRDSAIQEQLLYDSGQPVSEAGFSAAATTEAVTLTQRAQNKLREVETFVKRVTRRRDGNVVSLQYRVWLRERGRLQTLREELKSSKLNLALYFSTKSR
jgi:hypothetical protein